MSKYEKVLFQVMRGVSDQNISFKDLCGLLDHLGFNKRIKGSHHIYFREDIEEIINLQPKDSKAKSYQVKQVRNIIIRYRLGGE
ncbi:MAG: type II toxin-antitoxin system HicA family toxin [Candidatus Aminicenantes bacterium]|jgi:predicted RNA binding protein YcfA (HicA-like mRNA interferase family)